MSQSLSFRVPDELAVRLERFARRLGNDTTRSRAGLILLDEALREDEFAGIEFRNTLLGRQPFVKRTGMAVWEVIMVAKGFDLDAQATANHLECPIDAVNAALNYYAGYPTEIEHAILDNDVDEIRLRRQVPSLRSFEVPADRSSEAS